MCRRVTVEVGGGVSMCLPVCVLVVCVCVCVCVECIQVLSSFENVISLFPQNSQSSAVPAKTPLKCSSFDVPLCFVPGRDCYNAWHGCQKYLSCVFE